MNQEAPPTKDEIFSAIEGFLSNRIVNKSYGDYAPVAPEELCQLRAIVEMLIKAKYEGDYRGETPVDFKLWDLNKHRDHFLPIPKNDETKEYANVISYNLMAANKCVESYFLMLRMNMEKQEAESGQSS
jgi:hypothetical protein